MVKLVLGETPAVLRSDAGSVVRIQCADLAGFRKHRIQRDFIETIGREPRGEVLEEVRVLCADAAIHHGPILPLACCDTANEEDQRCIAEVQSQLLRRDLERFVKLGQFATAQSVDTQRALVRQLEAALQVDQANIDAAALELDYTTIRTPISGRTSVRLIDAGNIVRAGEAGGIVVVTQLQPISVAFSLPQQHLVTVNQAMAKGEVQVAALDADGKTVWEEGALSVVDNRIDVQTGTIRLKATFANPERKLWPGQFVNVRVRLDTYRDGNIVPAAAIQRNGSGTFAYVVDPEDRVELRPIRVGQIDGGIALVESGLEPGQRVVVTSQEQLRPGASVIPTEAASESGSDVSQLPSTIGASAGTPPARGQRQRP